MSQTRIAKPHDIRWPGEKGLPRSFEDINANFDALFRALEGAGISPAGVISPPAATGGGGTGTTPGLSDPVTEPHGGTGKTTYSKGDLLVGKADHKLDRLAIGGDGEVLKVAAGTADWVSPAHSVLSAVHDDATAASVVRGDLITGQGSTPKWKRLAKGALNYVLRMGADEPGWADPAHDALSATHSDTTAAAVVRGDLIAGKGATPKWERVAKGNAGDVLTMGADEPGWAAAAGADHALLSATHTDSTPAAPTRGDVIAAIGASPKWEALAAGAEGEVLTMGANEPEWAAAAGGEEVDPLFALTKHYGFVDNAETSIACAAVGDGTYRFTLGSVGATWRYFRNGVLCTITGSKTVLLAGTNPPDEGMHYIYIDSEVGTLVDGAAWTLLDTKVPVCGIIFHGADTPKFWLADERHTCLIDRKMHYYEHTSEGTKHIYGGTPAGYTVAPVGPVNTENTFSLDVCLLLDEDLSHTIALLADGDGATAHYYILYRSGASTWLWEKLAMPYRWTNAGYIQYDASGTMTQGQANKYYNTYLLHTNLSGEAGFMVVHGRAEFSSLATAQAEVASDFSWAGLGIAEFVLAWQFTWATSNAYTTKGKCRLAATPKHLDVSVVTTAVASILAAHNHLAGLQGGAPDEYYHMTAAQDAGQWDALGAGVAVEAGTKLKIAGHTYIVQYDAGSGGAAATIDWQNGNEQILELTADCTLTFSNPQAGARYVIRFLQDGTGEWEVTWPATVVWSGGIEAIIDPAIASRTLVAFYWDGTKYIAAGANASALSQGMPEIPLAVLHGGTGRSAIADGELFAGDVDLGMSVVPAPTTSGQVLTANTGISRKMEWSSSPLTRATCAVYLVSDTVANDGTELDIEFDGEHWDTFAMHNPAVNPKRVTIPVGYAGKYIVCAGIGWGASGSATGTLWTRLYRNGSLCFQTTNPLSYIYAANAVSAWIMTLDAGDYLELRCYQKLGSTLAVQGGQYKTFLQLAQVM